MERYHIWPSSPSIFPEGMPQCAWLELSSASSVASPARRRRLAWRCFTSCPSRPKISGIAKSSELLGNNLWIIYGYGWWFPYPSKKDFCSSIGMMTFPIYWKIKVMFQPTNQIHLPFFSLPRGIASYPLYENQKGARFCWLQSAHPNRNLLRNNVANFGPPILAWFFCGTTFTYFHLL